MDKLPTLIIDLVNFYRWKESQRRVLQEYKVKVTLGQYRGFNTIKVDINEYDHIPADIYLCWNQASPICRIRIFGIDSFYGLHRTDIRKFTKSHYGAMSKIYTSAPITLKDLIIPYVSKYGIIRKSFMKYLSEYDQSLSSSP